MQDYCTCGASTFPRLVVKRRRHLAHIASCFSLAFFGQVRFALSATAPNNTMGYISVPALHRCMVEQLPWSLCIDWSLVWLRVC